MKKCMKFLVLVATLFTMSIFPSFAAETDWEITSSKMQVDIERSMSDSKYLNDSECQLKIFHDGNKLQIYAYSSARQNVDSIYVKTYIQRYNESAGSWENIYSKDQSERGSDFVEIIFSYYVDSGKYRLYSVHKAYEGDCTDQVYNYSGSVTAY